MGGGGGRGDRATRLVPLLQNYVFNIDMNGIFLISEI